MKLCLLIVLGLYALSNGLHAQHSNKKNQLEILLTANSFFEGKGMDWGVPEMIADGTFRGCWGLQYIRGLQSPHAARVSVTIYSQSYPEQANPRPFIEIFQRYYFLYSAGYQYNFVGLRQVDISALAEVNLRDGDEIFYKVGVPGPHIYAGSFRLLDFGVTAGVRAERMLSKYFGLSLEAKYMRFLYLHDEVVLDSGTARASNQTFTLQLGVGVRF